MHHHEACSSGAPYTGSRQQWDCCHQKLTPKIVAFVGVAVDKRHCSTLLLAAVYMFMCNCNSYTCIYQKYGYIAIHTPVYILKYWYIERQLFERQPDIYLSNYTHQHLVKTLFRKHLYHTAAGAAAAAAYNGNNLGSTSCTDQEITLPFGDSNPHAQHACISMTSEAGSKAQRA